MPTPLAGYAASGVPGFTTAGRSVNSAAGSVHFAGLVTLRWHRIGHLLLSGILHLYTQNTHNTQNYPVRGIFAYCANSAYRDAEAESSKC